MIESFEVYNTKEGWIAFIKLVGKENLMELMKGIP